ncbi:hypothetical protein JL100_004040 [Skermanella mucosa]|uniref:hypothetical protein n=1 Tax=Skermanella mucosa TaxID=1789672 RepID=UPI00192B7936|nr:hypothetical protein [Skermanella mucosa]UEM21945.1 hypothetical protein JL100_004040 [Skermanella mucosa]
MAVEFTLEEYPLYDEAFAKGFAVGHAEGFNRGYAKGFAVGYAKRQTKSLLHLIECCCGSVPDHVPDRILAGSNEDRDRWLKAIIGADNLTTADLDAILNLQPS